jgi:aminoglycoside phosphotransferase (APT) family kinase protein
LSNDTTDGIDAEKVSAWLDANIDHASPPFEYGLISGGKSNLTYRVEDAAGNTFVLRRPPLGHVLQSAHDMAREHRIVSALAGSGVPVAATWGLCQDEAINSADFYIMDCVEGTVLHDATAAETLSAAERQEFGRDVADVLVKLHNLEPSDVGLGELGRREAYLDRQLKRWTGQWEQTKTHEEPEMDECLRLLGERKPEQVGASIVHGDYRPGNFMAQGGKIGAVFDWELCTLGDPLADVGYLLNNWHQPDEPMTATAEIPPISIGGFPTREELCAWYADGTGRDLSQIDYYRAFSHWRLACIVQGVYKRFLMGAMGDQEMDLEGYRAGVGRMATSALELLH